MQPPDPVSDSQDLASFGYRQELHRTLGSFSSFAAAFSYISILTGMFQLFAFGFAFAGPAFWWSWIIVFAGQFAVALCFSELAARYPIAGSVYQWAKQVSGKAVAWFAGWIMMLASIVTVAAVAIAWQIILPQISTHFQFVGTGAGKNDFAENAVILGVILIAFTTTVNILGVRLMSRINNVGVAAELIGATVLIILLAVHITRGPQVVTHTFGTGPGLPGHSTIGYGAAFLIGAIMPAYVMFGFDTAGSLAEETNDPRRRAPRAILGALGAAGVAGMLLLLFALMSVKNLHASGVSANGLPFIVKSVLGSTLGDILLWDVVLSISVCCLAIHTAAIRMMFSMARDNALPGSSYIAKVSDKSRTPIVPAVIVGALSIIILLVNINQPKIFTVITGIAIVMIYLAYLCVTVPLLRRRVEGMAGLQRAEGLFSMGGAGTAVNALAIAYGAFMAINIGWPRNEIYGAGNYMWGGLIFIVGALAIGGIYFVAVGQHRMGVLDSHASVDGELAVTELAGEQAFGGP
jgi:urea carboxylase system permease